MVFGFRFTIDVYALQSLFFSPEYVIYRSEIPFALVAFKTELVSSQEYVSSVLESFFPTETPSDLLPIALKKFSVPGVLNEYLALLSFVIIHWILVLEVTLISVLSSLSILSMLIAFGLTDMATFSIATLEFSFTIMISSPVFNFSILVSS